MPDPKIIQFPLGLRENLQYHYTKVEVSSAEILTLFSAPVSLVAAPGAGYILIPINAIVEYHFGTVAYDNTNDSPDIKNNGDAGYSMHFADILSGVADKIMFQPLGNSTTARTENTALVLTEDVDPTLGDGTLTVYLWYINLEL